MSEDKPVDVRLGCGTSLATVPPVEYHPPTSGKRHHALVLCAAAKELTRVETGRLGLTMLPSKPYIKTQINKRKFSVSSRCETRHAHTRGPRLTLLKDVRRARITVKLTSTMPVGVGGGGGGGDVRSAPPHDGSRRKRYAPRFLCHGPLSTRSSTVGHSGLLSIVYSIQFPS